MGSIWAVHLGWVLGFDEEVDVLRFVTEILFSGLFMTLMGFKKMNFGLMKKIKKSEEEDEDAGDYDFRARDVVEDEEDENTWRLIFGF